MMCRGNKAIDMIKRKGMQRVKKNKKEILFEKKYWELRLEQLCIFAL